MNNFRKYSTLIIIGILLLIILLQRSCTQDVVSKEPVTVVKIDTVWKKVHDTIIKKVKVTNTEYVPVDKIIFANVEECRREYNRKTTYKDTIVLDSLGTITIVDTVFQNALRPRSIFKDYKIPLVTKTVTITKFAEPKRQIYLGSNFFANKRAFTAISPGVIYKDRKDRIYQANVDIDIQGVVTYGLGLYWKINLNKK